MAMTRDKVFHRIVPRKVSSEAAARETLETGEKVLRLREELRKAEETPPAEVEAARFAPLMKPCAHVEDTQLQVKWSTSELKRLREEQEEGLSVPPFSLPQDGGSEVAAWCGAAYHKLFGRIDFTRSWTEEGLRDFLRELTETGALSEEDGTLIALSPAIRFLQSTLAVWLASAQRAGTLHRETSFVMAIPAYEADPSRQSEEPVVVQDVIDAWFEEAGQLMVLDYKTNRATEEARYREECTAQLFPYAWVLAMTEEKTVAEKLIYSTARGEVLAL